MLLCQNLLSIAKKMIPLGIYISSQEETPGHKDKTEAPGSGRRNGASLGSVFVAHVPFGGFQTRGKGIPL
jgi:hypothetical protein